MGKKLADIKKEIESKTEVFDDYFYSKISPSVSSFINLLKRDTQVFLFSGIIRDFFVKRTNEFRDIDLVIENELTEELLTGLNYQKNSFGGYKINIDNTIIDIWEVKNTWGFQKKSILPLSHSLPETTFFNFSSILYSLNKKEFIIGNDFLKFMKNKKIDIVFDINPLPELCIVNTIYYGQKLNYEVSNKLKEYIKANLQPMEKLLAVQEKHFKNIIYPASYMRQIFQMWKIL